MLNNAFYKYKIIKKNFMLTILHTKLIDMQRNRNTAIENVINVGVVK